MYMFKKQKTTWCFSLFQGVHEKADNHYSKFIRDISSACSNMEQIMTLIGNVMD